MKAKINQEYGELEVIIPRYVTSYAGWDRYVETGGAEPTNRVLAGSRDQEYDQEYIGHGHVDGIPVTAVYLLSEADYNPDEDGTPDDYSRNWDWDVAAKQGRLIVDIDALTDAECEALETGIACRREEASQ